MDRRTSFWPRTRVRRPADAVRLALTAGTLLVLVLIAVRVPGVPTPGTDLADAVLGGLPRTVLSVANGAASLGVVGLRTRTQAWRAVASKTVGFVALSVGGGQDLYRSRGRVRAALNETFPVVGPFRFAAEAFDLRQRVTRTNVFADLSLTLPVVILTGEVGRASGGTVVRSYNSFDGRDDRAGDPVNYAAVGLRLRF